MRVIFICINVRSPVFHILTSTDNKVKQLQKHSPVYNTCVKSNQLVLVIEVFSRKTHVFILLQGSGNLLVFLFLFEMLEPLTKFFQLLFFSSRSLCSLSIAACFLSQCGQLFRCRFLRGASKSSPVRFPLLKKVLRDRFSLDHLKIVGTAPFFRTIFLPFPSLHMFQEPFLSIIR